MLKNPFKLHHSVLEISERETREQETQQLACMNTNNGHQE